jgi:WD40 repeat protein
MPEAEAPSPVGNPYVGPVPFAEGRTLYGREKETDALYNLLISKRIVLLFSPSGAGKTSLIQAALLPRLRSRLNPLPIIRMDRVPDAGAHGRPANRYVYSALASMESRFAPAERLAEKHLRGLTLDGYFSQRSAALMQTESGKFPLIVLDQFEELFTLSRVDWSEKEEFLRQLGQVLGGSPAGDENQAGDAGHPGLPPVWALIALREDYVAELEPFLDFIPTGLAYRFRLEPLERDQAVEAVWKPAGDYFPRVSAEVLVDNLRRLRAASALGAEAWEEGRYVEPVHLQVVCQRLWEQVVRVEKRSIKPEDVVRQQQEGAVDAALSDYYDREIERAVGVGEVRPRDLRDWIEEKLITRRKIRTKTLREPFAAGSSFDKAIDALLKGHVLRHDIDGDREWIELSHDRLVDPVLRSNEAWRESHLVLLQRQAKLWSRSGKTKIELLFTGAELDEAEKFAREHPEDLDRDDREFLNASRLERERVQEDRRKTEEIRRKNKTLVSQRLILVLSILSMIIIAITAAYWGYLNKKNREIIGRQNEELNHLVAEQKKAESRLQISLASSQLRQAVAMSAKGRGAEGLDVILEANEAIAQDPLDEMQIKFQRSLWEVMGRLPPVLREVGVHSPIVRALQFSADGKYLFSGGWDNLLKGWPVEPKRPGRAMAEHRANIYSLAYHAARKILVSSDQEGLILIWRIVDGQLEEVSRISDHGGGRAEAVRCVALNPDGTRLAAAVAKTIVLWNIEEPTKPEKVNFFGSRFHESLIYKIGFIEAGTHAGKLASADFDGKIGVWRLPGPGGASGQRPDLSMATTDFKQAEGALSGMAVSPDGRWLSAADFEGDVYIWGLEQQPPKPIGKRLNPKSTHRGPVFGMAFCPSGGEFVTVGTDEVLIRYDFPAAAKNVAELEKQLQIRKIEGWGEKLYSVAFHPDCSGVVAVGGTQHVRTADLMSFNPLVTHLKPVDRPAATWQDAAIAPDSTLLAAMASDRKRIHIWRSDFKGYQPVPQLSIRSTAPFAGMSIHPTGKSLATLTCGGGLAIWDLSDDGSPSPSVLREEAAQTGRCPPASISFSSDGKQLVDAIRGRLHLWTEAGSGSWQGLLLADFDKEIRCAAFSRDGRRLAAGGDVGKILLWDIANGRAEWMSTPPHEMESVRALAFGPDGQTLVTGGTDFIVREWVLPSLELRGQSALHKRAVNGLSFGLQQGRPVLFSADAEGQLVACLGGISSEQCVQLGWPRGKPIHGLSAAADVSRVVEAGEDLWVWELSFDNMLKTAKHLVARKE